MPFQDNGRACSEGLSSLVVTFILLKLTPYNLWSGKTAITFSESVLKPMIQIILVKKRESYVWQFRIKRKCFLLIFLFLRYDFLMNTKMWRKRKRETDRQTDG